MPHYRVRLEGTGILVRLEDGGDPAIGFFTTRQVRAESPGTAQARALSDVAAEWASGPYAAHSEGGRLSLIAHEVWPVTWWRALVS
jgi:hypothetical protein